MLLSVHRRADDRSTLPAIGSTSTCDWPWTEHISTPSVSEACPDRRLSGHGASSDPSKNDLGSNEVDSGSTTEPGWTTDRPVMETTDLASTSGRTELNGCCRAEPGNPPPRPASRIADTPRLSEEPPRVARRSRPLPNERGSQRKGKCSLHTSFDLSFSALLGQSRPTAVILLPLGGKDIRHRQAELR